MANEVERTINALRTSGLWPRGSISAPTSSTEPIRRRLNAPTRTRLIGPFYDPLDDAAHHMSGGSLASWFDVVVHMQEVTPSRPLL